MRWDSAMALTICAEGLEIMFPSWYCGGWGFISQGCFFFLRLLRKRERGHTVSPGNEERKAGGDSSFRWICKN